MPNVYITLINVVLPYIATSSFCVVVIVVGCNKRVRTLIVYVLYISLGLSWQFMRNVVVVVMLLFVSGGFKRYCDESEHTQEVQRNVI